MRRSKKMKQHVSTVLISALVVTCSATFGFAQGNQSSNAATTPPAGLRAELLRQLDDAQQKLVRSEEHTSELQSRLDLVCRLLLEKKKKSVPFSRVCDRVRTDEYFNRMHA